MKEREYQWEVPRGKRGKGFEGKPAEKKGGKLAESSLWDNPRSHRGGEMGGGGKKAKGKQADGGSQFLSGGAKAVKKG